MVTNQGWPAAHEQASPDFVPPLPRHYVQPPHRPCQRPSAVDEDQANLAAMLVAGGWIPASRGCSPSIQRTEGPVGGRGGVVGEGDAAPRAGRVAASARMGADLASGHGKDGPGVRCGRTSLPVGIGAASQSPCGVPVATPAKDVVGTVGPVSADGEPEPVTPTSHGSLAGRHIGCKRGPWSTVIRPVVW